MAVEIVALPSDVRQPVRGFEIVPDGNGGSSCYRLPDTRPAGIDVGVIANGCPTVDGSTAYSIHQAYPPVRIGAVRRQPGLPPTRIGEGPRVPIESDDFPLDHIRPAERRLFPRCLEIPANLFGRDRAITAN